MKNKNEQSMEWTRENNGKRKGTQEDVSPAQKKQIMKKYIEENNGNFMDKAKNNKKIMNKEENYYLENNKGPYIVWIQHKSTSGNDKEKLKQFKRLSDFKVGRLICPHYKSIEYINSKTKTKVEVKFKSMYEANKIIRDAELEENDFEAFMPNFRLKRKGIIKGIDEDIKEKKIIEVIESQYKVIHVKRLNKRNRNQNRQENEPKWIASRSVIITFSDQELPNEVYRVSRIISVIPL